MLFKPWSRKKVAPDDDYVTALARENLKIFYLLLAIIFYAGKWTLLGPFSKNEAEFRS